MSKINKYIRDSTDKKDLNNQKLEILEYARKKDLRVDEFVEITISSRKTTKQRSIDEVLQTLTDSDTLIVTELSRLGRRTIDLIALINDTSCLYYPRHSSQAEPRHYRHDMNSQIVITLFFSVC